MLTVMRRRWFLAAALALLGTAALAARAAAVPRPELARRATAGIDACRAAARTLLMGAPRVRRIDQRIESLIDARRYRQAVVALRNAARRQKDAWAGYALGGLYAAGLGVARNAHTAFQWYLWAARHGNHFAQRQVANAYLNGVGTRRNPRAAAYWFRIGMAPWQLAGAYRDLAQTYARGHLVPVNGAKVAYYTARSIAELRVLARGPNADANDLLGLAYAYGRGVRRNRAKAFSHLCRAVGLRDPRAAAALLHLQAQPRGPSR